MADEPESNVPVPPSGTPEPAPVAAGGAPVLPPGWQQPEWVIAKPEPPPSIAVRVLEAVAWVVGILAVLFFGRTLWIFDPNFGTSGFEIGELVGLMIGAVLMGLFVRWLWVGFRHRGRVLSPWALLVAIALLAVNPVYGTVTLPPTVAAQPISTYLKIGAPYNLVTADADTVSQLAGGFTDEGAKETEVREITEGTETVGFLVVADVDATDSDVFRTGVESGFEKTEGAEAHVDTIGSTKVVVGTVSGVVAVFWAEEPYGLIVYAFDVDSGKALAGSVMDAYR